MERLEQGSLGALLETVACPQCGSALELTARRVHRGVVLARDGEFIATSLQVPLARCDGPKRHWTRLLPIDVIPLKTYTLASVEASAVSYFEPGGGGLRRAVGSLRGERPHHSTLHGWLGGMGRYALGRETPQGAVPIAAVLETTRRRDRPDIDEVWEEPVSIHPDRYRTEARREELTAAARLVATARVVAPDGVSSLMRWALGVASSLGVPPWGWLARSGVTPIQHPPLCRVVLASEPSSRRTKGARRCRIRKRSPPGASR